MSFNGVISTSAFVSTRLNEEKQTIAHARSELSDAVQNIYPRHNITGWRHDSNMSFASVQRYASRVGARTGAMNGCRADRAKWNV